MTVGFWMSMLFLITAAVCVVTGAIAWRRNDAPGARVLALLMFAVALWVLADALILMPGAGIDYLLWAKVSYLGRLSCPLLLLLFALVYTGTDRRVDLWWLALVAVIPVMSLVLAFTNEWHRLIWVQYTVDAAGTPSIMQGVGFWFAAGYLYAVLMAAVILLLQHAFRVRRLYRAQTWTLLAAVLLPFALNVVYLVTNPLIGIDLTGIAFALSGILLLWCMQRQRLFDLAPVAHSQLIHQTGDAILVFDATDRLVEVNTAAQQFLNIAPEWIGLPCGELLARLPIVAQRPAENRESLLQEIAAQLQAKDGAVGEVETDRGPVQYWNWRSSPLYSHSGRRIGNLMVWRNITASREALAAIYEQERAIDSYQTSERIRREWSEHVQHVLAQIGRQTREARTLLTAGQAGAAAGLLGELGAFVDRAEAEARHAVTAVDEEVAGSGFLVVLREYLEQFGEHYGLDVILSCIDENMEHYLTPAMRLQVVRIIQEALDNVQRHAEAHVVHVIFADEKDHISLVIVDDGVGFDLNALAGEPGRDSGLEAIRRRAIAAGGDVVVHTAPGAGTRLHISLPRWESTASHLLRGLRVLLAGESPAAMAGVQELLTTHEVQVIGMAQESTALLAQAHTFRPDVILVDVDAQALAADATIASLKADLPEVRIAVLTTDGNSQTVFAALRSGASGCLTKSLDSQEFVTQLAQIVQGMTPVPAAVASQIVAEFARAPLPRASSPSDNLTPRQQEIVRLVAQGLSYAEVGARLYLSERTVRYHMEQLRGREAQA